MNLTIFWTLFVGIQVTCLIIAYRASKRHKTQADYYLAGRSVLFFPLLMTFVATQVGGGLILGAAEDAYRYGWKIVFYPLGAICGFFLLSSFLGKRLAKLPVSTVAQIFEYSYGSVTLKRVASLLSIITLFMITVAQVVASNKFLASLELNNPVWFSAFWIIVFIYTMWGGLEGIASIDGVQATFFLIVLGASVFSLFLSDFNSVPLSALLTSDASLDATSWVAWFLMPCLFMLIEQDMAQRCFSARSSTVVKRAAIGSAIILFFVSIVPISFSLFGKANGFIVPNGESAFIYLVQRMTSPGLAAGVACGVMMAIISTAVSLIHSISSNLIGDFSGKSMSGKKQVMLAKAATLLIGLLALFASSYFDNIVSILIQSYELSVVCLFVPIIASLLREQRGPLPAYGAILFGVTSFLFIRMFELPVLKEVVELACSLVGFSIGHALQQRRAFRFDENVEESVPS